MFAIWGGRCLSVCGYGYARAHRERKVGLRFCSGTGGRKNWLQRGPKRDARALGRMQRMWQQLELSISD